MLSSGTFLNGRGFFAPFSSHVFRGYKLLKKNAYNAMSNTEKTKCSIKP